MKKIAVMVLYIRLCHPSTTILTSFAADLAKENNEQHTGCKLSFADMLYLSIWLIRLLATKYIKSNHSALKVTQIHLLVFSSWFLSSMLLCNRRCCCSACSCRFTLKRFDLYRFPVSSVWSWPFIMWNYQLNYMPFEVL